MKLSCIPVSFFKELIGGSMTVAEWARMGKEIGLDAIDVIAIGDPVLDLVQDCVVDVE